MNYASISVRFGSYRSEFNANENYPMDLGWFDKPMGSRFSDSSIIALNIF
jgi:hypothetical protein